MTATNEVAMTSRGVLASAGAGWPGKAAKPSMPTHFPFALFGTNGRISSKIGPKDNA